MKIRSRLLASLVAGTVFILSGPVAAMDDAALGDILERRIGGDASSSPRATAGQ